MIEALVADRDPRVVPMLARIVDESEPLGKDHEVVLETLDGAGDGRQRRGGAGARRRRSQLRAFFGGRKLRALKERGVDGAGRASAAHEGRGRARGGGHDRRPAC